MTKTHDRDYYTVPEVADLLALSPSTIWRWIKAGRLPAYRVGERAIRIKKADLELMVTPTGSMEPRDVGPGAETLFTNYDPERVLAALAEYAGGWSDLDTDKLLDDRYRACEAGSRPISRP